MLVHRRVTPSIKFVAAHLYTWVERSPVRMKCLAQEYNTLSLARRAFLKRPENFSGPETAPQSSRNHFRVFLKAPEKF